MEIHLLLGFYSTKVDPARHLGVSGQEVAEREVLSQKVSRTLGVCPMDCELALNSGQ